MYKALQNLTRARFYAVQNLTREKQRLPKTDSISISFMCTMESWVELLDEEIERQVRDIPNTLLSVPGIGPVLCAGILAEVGDINRFNGQAALAKYAGLAWSQDPSRLIKSGNRFLKHYLCAAAYSMVRSDAEFKRYYDVKYKEVEKYPHDRALVLTARKLVRLVFRLIKDGEGYEQTPVYARK